jgi:hypothetical protein
MTHRPKIIIKKTDRRLILSIADGADRSYPATTDMQEVYEAAAIGTPVVIVE